MKFGESMSGTALAEAKIAKLSDVRRRKAIAAALNDTGFYTRGVMQDAMRSRFDRPTDYILRSPRLLKATPDRLLADILPKYPGGKGIDPQKILDAQSHGGRRRDKRSEIALRKVGILPNGYQTTIPGKPYEGTVDGFGNIKGSFIAQLISYFQASSEQGYRANMSDKRKRQIHRGTKAVRGRSYFISYGRLRDGNWQRGGGYRHRGGGAAHLHPGIWAKSGTGGVDIQPVLMFVRRPNYTPLLSMDEIAKSADISNYLARRIRYRLLRAVGL